MMKIHIKIKDPDKETVKLDNKEWYVIKVYSVDDILAIWNRLGDYGFYWKEPHDLTKNGKILLEVHKTFKKGGEVYIALNTRTKAPGGSTINPKAMSIHAYDKPQHLELDNPKKVVLIPLYNLLKNPIVVYETN